MIRCVFGEFFGIHLRCVPGVTQCDCRRIFFIKLGRDRLRRGGPSRQRNAACRKLQNKLPAFTVFHSLPRHNITNLCQRHPTTTKRNGSACLNNFPRFISGLRAGYRGFLCSLN